MYALIAVVLACLVAIHIIETYWPVLVGLTVAGVLYLIYSKKKQGTGSRDFREDVSSHAQTTQASSANRPQTVAEENAIYREKHFTSIQTPILQKGIDGLQRLIAILVSFAQILTAKNGI